jgi:glutathione S-transferase
MKPVLYSFRRCPYAMRARLALISAQTPVVLREILLRDKPAAFLEKSPSGTVPCLITGGEVIDESLDVMKWALALNDPDGMLDMPKEGWDLIDHTDGPFKLALDRTKYAARYPEQDTDQHRTNALAFLMRLDQRIDQWIFERATIADIAILPFVRQFAFIDKPWFDAQPMPNVHAWLDRFLKSDAFELIMPKFAPWQEGDAEIFFPDTAQVA